MAIIFLIFINEGTSLVKISMENRWHTQLRMISEELHEGTLDKVLCRGNVRHRRGCNTPERVKEEDFITIPRPEGYQNPYTKRAGWKGLPVRS